MVRLFISHLAFMNQTTWIAGVLAVLVLAGLGMWIWGAPSNVTETTDGVATTSANTGTESSKPVQVESRSSSSVAQVVASLNTGSFNALLAASGVSISGKGPYTIFVPTNEAFGFLPEGTISGMSAAEKKRLVQYHIVSGKMLDIDAVSTGSTQTLSGDPLNFQVNLQNGIVGVGGAYALNAYKANNGMVYLITAVLIPPLKFQ